MKKKLNIGAITNELEGASLFFAKPASPPPTSEPAVPANSSNNPLSDSPFFANTTPLSDEKALGNTTEQSVSGKTKTTVQPQSESSGKNKEKQISKKPSTVKDNDSMNTGMQASNNASMHANMQALAQDDIIEVIRKAVKFVGKDSATYRFTPEEKKALLELSFTYKMQGFKTSENELVRIAINFLLEDQKLNGRNSVLQRVLDALNK